MRQRLRCKAVVLAFIHASVLATPYFAAESAERCFAARDLMKIGAYCHPEHWPREQWERDFAKMEETRFEMVASQESGDFHTI